MKRQITTETTEEGKTRLIGWEINNTGFKSVAEIAEIDGTAESVQMELTALGEIWIETGVTFEDLFANQNIFIMG